MRLKLPVLFIFSCCLMAVACKKDENFSSRIVFVNAAISNPAITLKADSAAVFSNIRYDSLFTGVTASGTFGITLFVDNVAQVPLTTNLESGQQYIGMTYEDTNRKGGYFFRKDALPAAPGDGQCSVRIFDAVARTTNLYLAHDSAHQRQIISGISFANFSSSTAFKTIDTITRPSIRLDSLRAIAILPQPLMPGKIYTLYIIGRITDTITGAQKPKVIMQMHN